jgi:hypothetical protein
MSTIDKLNGADLAQLGPVYPFVGSEVFWFVLCVAFWLFWHFWQSGNERRMYREDERLLQDPALVRRAVHHDTLDGSDSSRAASGKEGNEPPPWSGQ